MERDRLSQLRPDGIRSPKPGRFAPDRADFESAMAAHRAAVAADAPGYADPTTGLFVMTASHLRDRGWCCERGCRHCPYEDP